MKTIIYTTLSVLLLTGCKPNTYDEALAEAPLIEGNVAAGQLVWDAKACASCHGPDGKTAAGGISRIIPDIGLPRDIENSLIALSYPLSDRDAVMKDIASGLGDQEVIDLSEYIYSLR